jgi:hypothetical protein
MRVLNMIFAKLSGQAKGYKIEFIHVKTRPANHLLTGLGYVSLTIVRFWVKARLLNFLPFLMPHQKD